MFAALVTKSDQVAMTAKRLLKVMLVLIALIGSLTACSQMTVEQIESSEHKITRMEDGSLFKQPTWKYAGPNGKETTLTVDCSTFTKACIKNEDDSVRLVYSNSKHGRLDHKLEVSGKTWDMDCTGKSWLDLDSYCAPRLD